MATGPSPQRLLTVPAHAWGRKMAGTRIRRTAEEPKRWGQGHMTWGGCEEAWA